MVNTLHLGFTTDQGRRHNITIPHADPFVDIDDLRGAMQVIIDANVINSVNGRLVERQSAKLVATERIPIPVN